MTIVVDDWWIARWAGLGWLTVSRPPGDRLRSLAVAVAPPAGSLAAARCCRCPCCLLFCCVSDDDGPSSRAQVASVGALYSISISSSVSLCFLAI